MIEKIRECKLGAKSLQLLNKMNAVVVDYQEQGYTLTLRQLYYQLVAADAIPNSDKEYKKIGHILKEARYGGLVDWAAIEDRLRKPQLQYAVDNIEEALEDTVDQYKLRLQAEQSTYIEVWVEKDALSSVLRRVTDKYHIRLMVNRGYGSASSMYEAYQRIKASKVLGADKCVVLYLGDHDPSGLDMIRDIQDRINEFEPNLCTVYPIALTMEQIEEYNPPPNPAKVTDTRAKAYIERHGNVSWEVDALPPNILNQVLTDAIEENIDLETYKHMVRLEAENKEELRTIISAL